MTVAPGERAVGEAVTIEPTQTERVVVGPVTTYADGTKSFTVTITTPPKRPGHYL